MDLKTAIKIYESGGTVSARTDGWSWKIVAFRDDEVLCWAAPGFQWHPLSRLEPEASALKEPLGIIRAAADGALVDLKEGLFRPEELRPLLEKILRQTDRMTKIAGGMPGEIVDFIVLSQTGELSAEDWKSARRFLSEEELKALIEEYRSVPVSRFDRSAHVELTRDEEILEALGNVPRVPGAALRCGEIIYRLRRPLKPDDEAATVLLGKKRASIEELERAIHAHYQRLKRTLPSDMTERDREMLRTLRTVICLEDYPLDNPVDETRIGRLLSWNFQEVLVRWFGVDEPERYDFRDFPPAVVQGVPGATVRAKFQRFEDGRIRWQNFYLSPEPRDKEVRREVGDKIASPDDLPAGTWPKRA